VTISSFELPLVLEEAVLEAFGGLVFLLHTVDAEAEDLGDTFTGVVVDNDVGEDGCAVVEGDSSM
jgi:hypothetical protein